MAIRNELQLKAGDHLIVRVRDGVIVLVPRPQDAVEQLKGLHREICQGDVDEYIEEERNAWDDPDAADVTR
jgi:hypothetical protein